MLGLYLYQGRWQLGAATALYSDGYKYRPLHEAFHYLKRELQQTKQVLVLGAGLGSAVYVLDHMGIPLPVTLVDLDETVLEWAKEILPEHLKSNTTWICADAQQFVATASPASCDLLVIDIFQDRIVPVFATSKDFLQHCSKLLRPEPGLAVINYIVNNEDSWETAKSHIKACFSIRHIISIGINKIIIATPLQQ